MCRLEVSAAAIEGPAAMLEAESSCCRRRRNSGRRNNICQTASSDGKTDCRGPDVGAFND